MSDRRRIADRIHSYLAEPEGRQFVYGKWRFWWPAVTGFTILNALLTAIVFSDAGQLQNYIGAAMAGVGGLLAWLCVGALHYSDSTDVKLARGVSALDSLTLLFVAGHFCFLLYVYGHLHTLQGAEAEYKTASLAYNAKAEKISEDNKAIAASAAAIAAETTKAERLRNDTMYQARKAAQSGAKVNVGRSGAAGIAPSLSTAPIELERPTAPAESSVAFLTRWDAWIRILNFGELALAVITLIFIRNRSAKTNTIESVPLSGVTGRALAPRPAPAFDSSKNNDTVSLKNDDTPAQKKTTQATRVVNQEGLKRLRDALKQIAFDVGKTHFKVDPKPTIGAVWVRQYRSEHGEAREVAAARAKIDILDDAVRMSPEAFRAKLERFLHQNGFEV